MPTQSELSSSLFFSNLELLQVFNQFIAFLSLMLVRSLMFTPPPSPALCNFGIRFLSFFPKINILKAQLQCKNVNLGLQMGAPIHLKSQAMLPIFFGKRECDGQRGNGRINKEKDHLHKTQIRGHCISLIQVYHQHGIIEIGTPKRSTTLHEQANSCYGKQQHHPRGATPSMKAVEVKEANYNLHILDMKSASEKACEIFL